MSSMMDISEDSKLRQMAVSSVSSTTGDSIQELLNWNNLTYTMPITNSVVSARNVKTYPADQASYNVGTPWIIYVQTGSQYVDWTKSFLSFSLTGVISGCKSPASFGSTAGSLDVGFGIGSVCNFIDSIIVTTRSGAEVHRIEKFNMYRIINDYLNENSDFFQTEGSLSGYTAPESTKSRLDTNMQMTIQANTGSSALSIANYAYNRDFIIPMYKLGGIFESKQLCPATLASGLRIEIRTVTNAGYALNLSSPELAQSAILPAAPMAATATAKFTNMKLHCDTYLLNDAAMRELNQTSARFGLEYVYNECFHQTQVASVTTNLVCSKAVSRALNAKALIMKKPSIILGNDDFDWNTIEYGGTSGGTVSVTNCASEAIVDKYFFRLGSQYFPHSPVEGSLESYWQLLYTERHLGSRNKSLYKESSFFETSIPLQVATFERSNTLRYSGVPINNSRTLALQTSLKFPAVTGSVNLHDGCQMHVWLEYLTLAKAFLNNVVVSV